MTKEKHIGASLSPRERVRVRGYHEQWQSLLIEHLQKSTKPLLVILGPTASGKTGFSIEVAKWIADSLSPRPFDCRSGRSAWPIEIINADSRQLYKHMDIGTAKITPEEMGGIPHHLFSVLDPKEEVTVGWYKRAAEKVIDEVLARGSLPILVGGSMLYISAVTDGYVFTGRGGKRRSSVPYDLLIFGMQWPREELVKRIEGRTRKLLNPWLIEVESLLSHGYEISDPGLKSHGYREIAQWILDGKQPGKLQDLEERINANTRQYTKRQMTWWRHDKRIHWILCNSQLPSKTSYAQRKSISKLSGVSAFAQWKSCFSTFLGITKTSPKCRRSLRPALGKR